MESNIAFKHARRHEARPPRVEKEFRLDSNDFDFICTGESIVDGYKKEKLTNLRDCYKLTAIFSTNEKLFVSWQFSETYSIFSYGSGWRKDVGNRWQLPA